MGSQPGAARLVRRCEGRPHPVVEVVEQAGGTLVLAQVVDDADVTVAQKPWAVCWALGSASRTTRPARRPARSGAAPDVVESGRVDPTRPP